MNLHKTDTLNINDYMSAINLNITHELNRCIKDLRAKIQTIDKNSTGYSTVNNSIRGGDLGKLNEVTKFVASRQTSKSKTAQKEEQLKEKLLSLESHIKKVVSEIDSVASSTADVDALMNVRRQYEQFNEDLDKIVRSKGYRLVKQGSNFVLDERDDESERLLSSLYNLWTPFITNYKELIQSIDKTDDQVLETLRTQSEQNLETLNLFDVTIDEITNKIDESVSEPLNYKYALSDTKPKQDDTNYTTVFYERRVIDQKSKIKSVDEGTLHFTKESVYNFMRDVDFKHPDSLTLIESDKMRFIEQFVKRIGSEFEFSSSVELGLGTEKSIVNEKILSSVSKLETIQIVQNKEMDGGGKFTAFNTKTQKRSERSYKTVHHEQRLMLGGDPVASFNATPLADSILKMTSKIADINIKLEGLSNKLRELTRKKSQLRYYILYLMNTSSLRGVSRLNVYRFINRGVLEFYLNILKDIGDRISKSEQPVDAVYFDTYHRYTIQRVTDFLLFLTSFMDISDLIDIEHCTGSIVFDFVLFNHFKGILESYYETVQNNISIYARINDFDHPSLPQKQNRLFIKDASAPRNIIAKPQTCAKSPNGAELAYAQQKSVKFNMVFDYDEFKNNEDISMYMSISTNMSKKKGVALITYGYSGTGKTFTLFGDGKSKGLLQSAIEGISSKSEIYFRAYEMYGAGVKYPFYWCDSVTETCYVYKINSTTYKINDVVQSDVDAIVSNTIGDVGYTKIEKQHVKSFFKNFNVLVDEIDEIRQREGRIKPTPNNPVSSRSIIIYDLMVRVEDDLVRLVVIDLPGREEIVQTYTQDYIKQNPRFDTPFHRAVLSSMSIDPLYLAVLCPVTIVQAFNDLSIDLREHILTQPVVMDDLGSCLDMKNQCILVRKNASQSDKSSIYIPPDISDESSTKKSSTGPTINQGVAFLDEPVLTLTNGTVRTISQLITVDKTYQIALENNSNYKGDPSNISDPSAIAIKFTESNWKILNKTHVRNGTTVQYQAVIAIHLLNRILLLKDGPVHTSGSKRSINKTNYSKFDVLESIYSTICSKFGYDGYEQFFRAPFEGVYINENIVGLLKVLSTDKALLNKPMDQAMKIIAPQKNISFKVTKQLIRENNVLLYRDSSEEIDPMNAVEFEGVTMNSLILDKIYEQNKNNYSSQKIFLMCEPLIERVIKYYVTDTQIKSTALSKTQTDEEKTFNVTGIRDIKIFYLFSNVKQDLKCVHQYKLFANTLGLMDLIDNTNL
ncbi:hypothetical protein YASMINEVIRUS_945 [Yasminevirus sp. GU-2018]|uniref:Kinesin motor domain-containing protein n=1 Tax=Yasminevirus sp. GU-2018 TaxID=2420051 RepID=A0A5K0UAF9_9VIRU|nr:hypothetical protein YASMINEVIRUS_945 [Yasminevirus sp. GU-2018]